MYGDDVDREGGVMKKYAAALLLIFCVAFQARAGTIDFCQVFIKDSLTCSITQNDFGKGVLYLTIPNENDTLDIRYFSGNGGFGGHDFVVRDKKGKMLLTFKNDENDPASCKPFLLPVKNLSLEGSCIYLVSEGEETAVLNIVILPRQ
ncbi:MAG TPA: hypothetical protein VFU15_00785 [Bacteroidia bacterium]|nr:hypothetical protein [Bacteroidia bacterium]